MPGAGVDQEHVEVAVETVDLLEQREPLAVASAASDPRSRSTPARCGCPPARRRSTSLIEHSPRSTWRSVACGFRPSSVSRLASPRSASITTTRLPRRCERDREIGDDVGLADAALAARHRDHLHAAPASPHRSLASRAPRAASPFRHESPAPDPRSSSVPLTPPSATRHRRRRPPPPDRPARGVPVPSQSSGTPDLGEPGARRAEPAALVHLRHHAVAGREPAELRATRRGAPPPTRPRHHRRRRHRAPPARARAARAARRRPPRRRSGRRCRRSTTSRPPSVGERRAQLRRRRAPPRIGTSSSRA